MNILIKLTCLIGLVIAPILGAGTHSSDSKHAMASCCSMEGKCTSMSKEECDAKGCTNPTCEHMKPATAEVKVSRELSIEKMNVDGKVKASVTTVGSNGTKNTQTFEGTDEEVSAKIEEFKKK